MNNHDHPQSGTVVKITMLPQIDPWLNAIPVKIPAALSALKLAQKFIWKCKGTRIAK